MKAEYSVSVTRLINAPRARVFEAFTSAQALSQWFSPNADISLAVEVFEFAVNGDFRLRYSMPDGTQPVVDGVYEVIEPPHRIVFSWLWQQPDPHADIPTRVDVRLADIGDGTEITVTHERLPSGEARERYAKGWEGTIDGLERFVDVKDFDASALVEDVPHA